MYNIYSEHLKKKYGEKVYKIPVNLPVSCPNRDGCISTGGCTFCAEVGTGFEMLSNQLSVKQQIEKNIEYIGKKYNAQKFIIYFQNFTNTYMPLEIFKENISQGVVNGAVAISISTRPDCINDEYLKFLRQLSETNELDIIIELGLQTVNYKILKEINRGHTLAEFIDAVIRIKQYGFSVCSHMILNLPNEDREDVVEASKILSALGVDYVKLHSLYLCEGTAMGELYKKGEISLISKDEYEERVIEFLEYLDSDIVIERLIGRAPEENSLFVNWNTSWWKIKDEIEQKMKNENRYQGKMYDYLNGKALRKKGYL